MKDLGFNSIEELYNRVNPALYSRREELIRNKIFYIKEQDIWNYLVKNVWKDRVNLTLNDLVCDILYVNEEYLVDFVLKKVNNIERKINDLDSEDDLL